MSFNGYSSYGCLEAVGDDVRATAGVEAHHAAAVAATPDEMGTIWFQDL